MKKIILSSGMQYIVTHSNGHFEISDDQHRSLGLMDINTWRPEKARITDAGANIYDIASTGFWQTKKIITKNGLPYASLIPKLGSGITLSFENGRTYKFQKKSFWGSGDYILTDDAGTEVASIDSHFQWKKMSFQYDVRTNPGIPGKEISDILPFILVYCVKLMRIRQSGYSGVVVMLLIIRTS